MSNESRKELAGRLFVVCLSCAAVGTVAAAFMMHPAFGLAVLSAILYGAAALMAQIYKEIESEKSNNSSKESNAESEGLT